MAIQSFKVKSFDQRLFVIRLLVQNGADLSLADQFQNTAKDLLEASFQKYSRSEIEQLQTFLMENCPDQTPPIYKGIYNNDPDLIQSTVESDNLSVNLIFEGKTPVICVVNKLSSCADLILEDHNKLHELPNVLEEMKQLETILQMLLSHGADLEIEPPKHKTMDQVSVFKPLHNLVCALRKLDSSGTHSQVDECYEILRRTILSLLHMGNAQVTLDTRLLLHQAARWDELKFIKFLIEELNVDPNTEGPQMMTPLHFAARSGRMDTLV